MTVISQIVYVREWVRGGGEWEGVGVGGGLYLSAGLEYVAMSPKLLVIYT